MPYGYILIVDDEPDIRNLLKEILEDEGYEVGLAESAAQARKLRQARRADLVLLDIWMPDEDGISLLKEWHETGGEQCPVIMMSGHGTVETAVEATRLGAYDFIEKPLSLAKLLVTVQRALEAWQLERENSGLRRRVQPVIEPVGRSEVMHRLRTQVQRIARHDTPVLLAGEAGSGKGVFARFIHHCGPRAQGPFIEVSVASLQGENPAAELFGHEEGGVHYGLLEQANGGTLLLDDIAELDLGVQARLLGALESGSYLRVGGNEPIRIDLHLIAASRYNLDQLVADGRLRNDLYYLLNVVPLHIPSLAEHAEDVPDLINFYVDHFVRTEKLPYRTFSVAAQNRLRHHQWPGNVRELKNLVQRLLIAGGGEAIEAPEVEAALGLDLPDLATPSQTGFRLPLREARERFEHDYFEHLLREYSGSVNRVAQHAGVERTHLYRKLRSLGLDPKQFNG